MQFIGNEKNQFVGATQWFYCEKSQFGSSSLVNTTFNYTDVDTKIIVPYSYNFVAMQIRGEGLIGHTLTDIGKAGLLQADMQFCFHTNSLAALKNITAESLDSKRAADHIPYVQFDILKGA